MTLEDEKGNGECPSEGSATLCVVLWLTNDGGSDCGVEHLKQLTT